MTRGSLLVHDQAPVNAGSQAGGQRGGLPL
jgi:hypothetical protein